MRGLLILNVLILSASSTYGKVICEQFGTYYTYCKRGYSCCFKEYCCENSVVINHVTNETSLTGGVIAAIVISSIVLVILLGFIAMYTYTRCNKDKRVVQVIQVQPGVSAIPMQNYRSPPQIGQSYAEAGDEGLYGGPIFQEQNKTFPFSNHVEYGMPPQYHPRN